MKKLLIVVGLIALPLIAGKKPNQANFSELHPHSTRKLHGKCRYANKCLQKNNECGGKKHIKHSSYKCPRKFAEQIN